MQNFKTLSKLRLTILMVGSVLALGWIWPMTAMAQEFDRNMSSQLMKLQEQVARLEAALKQNSNGTASDTPAQSDPAGTQDTTSGGAPAGSRIRATHQNCLQCHQTRPSGPLPPSHLERLGGGAADGQGASSAGAGQAAMGQGGQGMGGGMGKGMMGGGMGMGMGKGKMGGGMGMMGGGQAATGGSTTRTVDEQMQQMQQQMQQIMQMQMLQMRMMEMQLKMMKMMK
mgnify:CR=1 FL=1